MKRLTQFSSLRDLTSDVAAVVPLSAIDKFLQGQDAFVSGLSNARSEVEDFLGISDEVKRVGPAFGSAMDPAGDAFDDTAASAAALEDAISGLSSEIDDYIGGLFDVPDAQQALRQSFSDLGGRLDHALHGVGLVVPRPLQELVFARGAGRRVGHLAQV
jgi:hypothetical protein